MPTNGNGDNGAGGDYFRADRAWFNVVLLTIGNPVSRGLAKSGSREHVRRLIAPPTAADPDALTAVAFPLPKRTFPWTS